MSRNFYDYQISNTIKPRQEKSAKKVQEEPAEDTSARLSII